MPIKFVPQSDDPYLRKEADMSLAKFGHINFLLDQINSETLYVDNAAAIAGGLVKGDFYQNSVTRAIHVVHD